jgi:hypothetical protein
MFFPTFAFYSLRLWIEGVTTFFYSPSIQGGWVLAPFTRMPHLLLCLLTSSSPPSSLAACTDRYSQSMHVLSLARGGVNGLAIPACTLAWHPKRSPWNARKLDRLLVLDSWCWRSCAFYLRTEGVTDKISLHDSTGIKILILLSLFHSGSKYF